MEEFLNPREHHHQVGGVGSLTQTTAAASRGVKTVRHIAKWYESTLVGGGEEEEEDKNVEERRTVYDASAWKRCRKFFGRPRPVVVLVSDVEGFQRVVGFERFTRLFKHPSTATCHLYYSGIATNTSAFATVHSVRDCFQTATKVFKLFAPTDASREIREKFFLDPTLYPTLGNDALTYLHTRFMEHDFSLTTMRRSVKVLYLNRFATERLSYVNNILNGRDYSSDTMKKANGEGTTESVVYCLKQKLYSHGTEEALKWYLKRFCGLILSRDDQKSIEMLRELFFIQEDGKVNDDDDILDAFTENMLRVGDSERNSRLV